MLRFYEPKYNEKMLLFVIKTISHGLNKISLKQSFWQTLPLASNPQALDIPLQEKYALITQFA